NADDLRVRVSDIAQAVNLLIAGEEVSTFDVKDEQYDVRMRAAPEFRRSRKGLERVVVRSETGEPVTLDRVVDIVPGTGPTTIERLNRERQFTLLANVLPGGSQAAVIAEIERIVREIGLPPGYSSGVTGRSRELGRAGYYFGLAFLLSFVFMYMVLAAQFESFLHPVTILLTLPLAVPFGILSLLLFGQTVNVYSGLGLLLLFGIVKKNAILQIDHTNGLRAAGMERYEAIIQANRDRLRPILMTTISLVAGMLPLVFSSGPGSATNRSIGVLVAGGQTLCLLLTLLAVPVFYSLFDDVRELPVWRRMGRRWERWSSGVSERLSRIRARVRDSIRRPREG
ncbi:MAG: efflux RND transporter permease subunit, partial [Bryobacteraceae bacterium]|nr:efflux RND transporter permease subunit [Bryobacteraceae bacterium]